MNMLAGFLRQTEMRESSCFRISILFLSTSNLVFFAYAFNHTVGNVTNAKSSSKPVRISVDLPSIGYHGTWEQFCDPEEIIKDYQSYPRHELRNIRLVLCQLKKQNTMDHRALAAFAAFKYCVVMRPRIDEFLYELTKNLARDDLEKRKLLLVLEPMNNNTVCYHKCLRKFGETCIEDKNPYFNMFKPIIARACEMFWLSSEDIKECMEKVCAHRFVGADNWTAVLKTIKYKQEI